MKRSRTSVTKVLFASVLAAVVGMIAGPVSADPAGLMLGYTGSSDAMLLASTDFKGEHRYTSHVAYERQSEKGQPARLEKKPVTASVIFKGKPPYNRHIAKQAQLEKVQFARFEEKTGITKDEHNSIYHGAQGKRPPYRRNW